MTIALLPQDDANTILGECPLSQGLATKLLNKGTVAVNMRNQKIYSCRHCVEAKPAMPTTGAVSPKSSSETNPAASSSTGGGSSATATNSATSKDREPTLYIFDGLRSHLKGL